MPLAVKMCLQLNKRLPHPSPINNPSTLCIAQWKNSIPFVCLYDTCHDQPYFLIHRLHAIIVARTKTQWKPFDDFFGNFSSTIFPEPGLVLLLTRSSLSVRSLSINRT